MTNQVQVYINDQLIDLRPGTVIAKTIQAFDLFAFGTARANYTNQIIAPKTNNNQKALQFVDNIKSASTYAYRLLPARVIQNGIELIGNGFAQIVSTDTSYNITFFDGNYGFFTQIANRKLWDVDLSSLNQAWANADIDAARANASGLVSAIINFGQLIASGANMSSILNTQKFLPSIYYSTLIDKIFKTFGFTSSGNVFTNAKFLKMVMPLAAIYSPKFCAAKEFNAAAPGTQVMVNPVAATKVTFNQIAVNGSDNLYDGIDTYTSAGPTQFMANFATLLNITVAGGTVDLILGVNNGVNIGSTGSVIFQTGVGSGTYSTIGPAAKLDDFGGGLYGVAGAQAWVKIQTKTGAPTVTINSGAFWNKIPVLKPGNNIVPYYLTIQHLLPDMLITDFMKDFAVRFGLLFKESRGVMVARNIDDLINDTGNAIDWTNKRDKSVQEKITYQFQNFSQVNKLKWSNIADNTLNADFAMGSFSIANPNLSPEQTITSPISATQTLATLGVNMGQAQIWDNVANKYIAEVGARLMLLRAPYAGEPTIELNAATFRADYQVGYFLDGKQPYQMDMSKFIAENLVQFPIRMQNAKMVLRSYNLNDMDINNFDQLKQVYDDGANFIVNKIISYVPGKSTSVELFKL